GLESQERVYLPTQPVLFLCIQLLSLFFPWYFSSFLLKLSKQTVDFRLCIFQNFFHRTHACIQSIPCHTVITRDAEEIAQCPDVTGTHFHRIVVIESASGGQINKLVCFTGTEAACFVAAKCNTFHTKVFNIYFQ